MMECSICNEVFDAEQRRPKVLPCGHSFCLHCLDLLPKKECPIDRKVYEGEPAALPDNFLVLQASERPRPGGLNAGDTAMPRAAHRFWCSDCEREASAACVEEHNVCSLKKVRAQRAQPHLEGLQAGAVALQGLCGILDGVEGEAEELRGQLNEKTTEVHELLLQLRAALGAEEILFEQARAAAAGAKGLPRHTARLLAALADPASECSVALEAPGGAWRGSVRPREAAAARLLLCRLLCDGRLQRGRLVEAEDEQPEAQEDDGPQQAVAQEVVVPIAAPRWQEKSNGFEMPDEEMQLKLRGRNGIGRRVARGIRWSQNCTHDGSPPGHGTVTAGSDANYVYVHWDCERKAVQQYKWESVSDGYSYSTSKYRSPLKLLPSGPSPPGGIAGISRIDAFDISKNSYVIADSNLLVSEGLDQVRMLIGLCCKVVPAWSLSVLKEMASHLEVLGLRGADELHLRAVTAMPRLHSLFLDSVTWDTLQLAVSMPTLRRLEVHCSPDAPLVPGHGCPGLRLPRAPALEWLRVGVYPLTVALAVMRAHAATLRELELVAATDQPYGCPDLARELADCGLRKLKRLALLRESDAHFCRHDGVSCQKQKAALWNMLFNSGLQAIVVCSICDPEK